MVSRIKALFHPLPEMVQAKEELQCKIADALCRHEENIRSIDENKQDIERMKNEDTRLRKGA